MCVGRRGAACGVTVSGTHDERGILAIADASSRYYTEPIPTKLKKTNSKSCKIFTTHARKCANLRNPHSKKATRI